MNALHSTTTGAVLQTRTHVPAVRGAELSRGGCCNRVTIRSTAQVVRNRPPYFTAIEGGHVETPEHGAPAEPGGSAYREATGERDTSAEADFTAYVQERRASLYATAYHLTGDRYEAEDLLQSALFSTYRAWDRITDKAAVGGYLRRTMTNLHISAWRRRRLSEYPTDELPETATEIDAMRGTELRAVLWTALAKLPQPQRTMLVLRYYEGRTDPEIADILGISVGTVKSSIWRSLRRLREDETLGGTSGVPAAEDQSFSELVA
jgi:RNA polymerase sigma-70 factor (sigma-E family)